MVTLIKNWSTTAGDNDSPSPNGAPEGMAPSGLNNVIRQVMAEVREWYEDASWIDLGLSGLTYVNGTQFRLSDDQTAQFHVNRRIRATGTTPFTIYGTITASSYSSPNTTITVSWDSGSMDNTLSAVALGVEANLKPIPYEGIKIPSAKIPTSDLAFSFEPPVGAMMMWPDTSSPDGWLAITDATIGNASSGADNADDGYEDLFTHLWNKYSDTYCAVSSGRGASAAADWSANKTINLPYDYYAARTIVHIGQGETAEGDTTGTERTAGQIGGYETHTLTEAQLASHRHGVKLYEGPPDFTYLRPSRYSSGSYAGKDAYNSIDEAGSDDPHNNMPPYATAAFIIYSGVYA